MNEARPERQSFRYLKARYFKDRKRKLAGGGAVAILVLFAVMALLQWLDIAKYVVPALILMLLVCSYYTAIYDDDLEQ